MASAAQQPPEITKANKRDSHPFSPALKAAFKRKGAKLETSFSSSNQGEAHLLTLGGTGLPWISIPPAQGKQRGQQNYH